jgi:hypothetical protein
MSFPAFEQLAGFFITAAGRHLPGVAEKKTLVFRAFICVSRKIN